MVYGYLRIYRTEGIELQLIQGKAPEHTVADTKNDLAKRDIYVIYWPAFSPDLNPIEKVWNIIKNNI